MIFHNVEHSQKKKKNTHNMTFDLLLCSVQTGRPLLIHIIYKRYFHLVRLLFKGWYTSLSIKFMYLMVTKFFFSSTTANAYEYFHFDAQ